VRSNNTVSLSRLRDWGRGEGPLAQNR
jgi:hypothetical protein